MSTHRSRSGPVRIGVIGGGIHSRNNHLPALRQFGETHAGVIELAAFCDVDSAVACSTAREFGFSKWYESTERMLASERLDGCIAVTPLRATAAIARQVVATGTSLLMEKPPGASPEEAAELLSYTTKQNARVMVSMNRRHDPALRLAREAIGDRQIEFIRSTMLRHDRTEPDFFTATAIHIVDTVRWIAGEVDAWNVIVRSVNGVRWYHVHVGFASGATGLIDVYPACGVLAETHEIYGEDYRVFASSGGSGAGTSGAVTIHENGVLVRNEPIAHDLSPYEQNGTYGETVEFIASLLESRQAQPSLADVVPSVHLCNEVESVAGSVGALHNN